MRRRFGESKTLELSRKLSSRIHPKHQCYVLCLCIIVVLLFTITIMDWMSITSSQSIELIRLQKVGIEAEEEWIPVLTHGKIKTVNSFHKGLAQKFEIIFESGHVCAGKPILPETQFGVAKYETVKYNDLLSRQQRGIKRAEWEFQGWSEIVSSHVDKILGFHKKPPIVGRTISSKDLYANDPSWNGLMKRISPSYDIPMALLPWVDGLQRGIPDLDIRDFLIGNYTRPVTRKFLAQALAAADKLVFDFLVDDHDTQGTQNWKADMAGNLLHWDTGLGWRDGPYPRSSCYDILCGTKQWKGIEHHDPNPETCDRICTFRNSTVNMLKEFNEEKDKHRRLSYLLHDSLRADPLYPVFNLSLWRYYTYDKDGNRDETKVTHISVDEFLLGMDEKVKSLLNHIDECEETFGSEQVYQSE